MFIHTVETYREKKVKSKKIDRVERRDRQESREEKMCAVRQAQSLWLVL